MRANLPTVPVHDLTVHPRENDLVLGTYGRAVWVGDISVLQELDGDVLAAPFHAFEIEPRPFYGFRALGNYHLFGDRYLAAPNEPEGLAIRYRLAEGAEGPAIITITDIGGYEISTLEGGAAAGLNEVIWDLRPGAAAAGDDWRSRMRRFNTPPAAPGSYRVDIRVGAFEATRIARVLERVPR